MADRRFNPLPAVGPGDTGVTRAWVYPQEVSIRSRLLGREILSFRFRNLF